MSTDLATTNNVDELGRIGKMLALSGYFDTDRDADVAVAQMAVKVLAGAELGFGPFASAQGISIIKGKPAIGANLMAAAVKGHPKYDYRVRTNTADKVSIEFFEGGESIGTSEFTIKDAQDAGLTNNPKNQTWKRYPRNMLFARAMSNGVRWYTPDVFSGNAVYVPEELDPDTVYTVEDPEPPQDAPDDDPPAVIIPPNRTSTVTVRAVAQPQPAHTAVSLIDGPTPAPVQAEDDLTPDELDLIGSWADTGAAKEWAMTVGACENQFEASGSLRKIVENDFGGKVTAEDKDAVLRAFYKRQRTKLADAKQVPA